MPQSLKGNNISLALFFRHSFNGKGRKVSLSRSVYQYPVLCKTALMAGADQQVLFNDEIQPAAQMGTYAGYGPRSLFADKKNKIVLHIDAPRCQVLEYLHMSWLFGGSEAKKIKYRITECANHRDTHPYPGILQKFSSARLGENLIHYSAAYMQIK